MGFCKLFTRLGKGFVLSAFLGVVLVKIFLKCFLLFHITTTLGVKSISELSSK